MPNARLAGTQWPGFSAPIRDLKHRPASLIASSASHSKPDPQELFKLYQSPGKSLPLPGTTVGVGVAVAVGVGVGPWGVALEVTVTQTHGHGPNWQFTGMHTVGTVGVGVGVADGVGVAAGPKQVCVQDRSGCVCALTERGTTTTKHIIWRATAGSKPTKIPYPDPQAANQRFKRNPILGRRGELPRSSPTGAHEKVLRSRKNTEPQIGYGKHERSVQHWTNVTKFPQ